MDSENVDILVFPEASLSGYLIEKAELQALGQHEIDKYIQKITELSHKKNIIVWFGTVLSDSGNYYNSAIGIAPDGSSYRYDKVNLATAERANFTAGDILPVFTHVIKDEEVKIAVQLCRELKFPEQWRDISKKGASILLHMNYALGDASECEVWRSQLIARASENQRFVISVNSAGKGQKAPSMVIHPTGKIITEINGDNIKISVFDMNTEDISNWYLSQSRNDIFEQ